MTDFAYSRRKWNHPVTRANDGRTEEQRQADWDRIFRSEETPKERLHRTHPEFEEGE